MFIINLLKQIFAVANGIHLGSKQFDIYSIENIVCNLWILSITILIINISKDNPKQTVNCMHKTIEYAGRNIFCITVS